MNICKLLQKQIYNILSHKYYVICFLFLSFTTLISLVHLCEVWLNGMMTTDERLLLSYLVDNIGGVSLEKRLCQYLPIDVVYTWVNGSDPLMQSKLLQYRIQLKMELTNSCIYTDCLPSHFTVVRISSNQHGVRLPVESNDFMDNDKGYKIILTNFSVPLQKQLSRRQQMWKLYEWLSPSSATEELKLTITDSLSRNNNSNVFNDLHQPHWTSDDGPNIYSTKEHLMLKLSKDIDGPVTSSLLYDWLGFSVKSFWYYQMAHVVVVQLVAGVTIDSVLQVKNNVKWRIVEADGGIKINVTEAYLVLELPLNVKESDYAMTRFDDKEELRYSLRSLEKYAPWVRRIYLVTNGQIPHWLNLENPKISVIPHEVIFRNKSDLPTFSSPAIEMHIHRIPGLSKKFLYLNDDLLLGSDVWPDDFISSVLGQKIYLSWPVPDCANECPWLWVSNGVCDKPCNISACDFDGGDCIDSGENENNFDSRNVNLLHEHDQDEDGWNNQDDLNNNMYDEVFGQIQNELRLKRDTISSDHIHDIINETSYRRSFFNSLFSNDKIKYIVNYVPKMLKGLFKRKYTVQYYDYYIHQNKVHGVENSTYRNYLKDFYNVFRKIVLPQFMNKSAVNFSYKIVNTNVKSNRKRRSALVFKQRRLDSGVNLTSNNDKVVHKVLYKLPFSTSIPVNVREISADHSHNESLNVKENRMNKYDSVPRTFLKKVVINEHITNRNKSFTNDRNPRGVIEFNETQKKSNIEHVHDHVHHDNEEDVTFNNRKMDTFAESLLYVQRILNKVYGFRPRKVPAHMPHLIDKSIMKKLQNRFKAEFDKTSSHRIRRPDDMQFAFSYFYYLMSEQAVISIEEMFDTFDTDESGTWSDREIRTVMTRLYPLPLHQNNIMAFEKYLKDCSGSISSTAAPTGDTSGQDRQLQYERYFGSTLPLITKNLVVNCEQIIKLMNNTFSHRKKYPFSIIKHEPYVRFHMISSNISELLFTLDKIRKTPKKFLCLNDNMDPVRTEDNELVRAVLLDFYHSLFPKASQFELSPEYRNRFLYYDEYTAWKFHHSVLTSLILFVILLIFVVAISYLFNHEISYLYRRLVSCIKRPSLNLFRSKRRNYQPRFSYKL